MRVVDVTPVRYASPREESNATDAQRADVASLPLGGPIGSVAGTLGTSPYGSPAAGFDAEAGGELLLGIGEIFGVTEDLETQRLFYGLPKQIEEFSDPKSQTIQKFASLASSVSELGGHSLEVASVQLVCGSVETLARMRDGELSPAQGWILIGGKLCRVLSLALEYHGFYKTAKGLDVAGIVLTMSDGARRLMMPEAKPGTASGKARRTRR
jgi:hypothetical protein